MQKDVFVELIWRLANLDPLAANSDLNLILTEDVRNYIIENAPENLKVL